MARTKLSKYLVLAAALASTNLLFAKAQDTIFVASGNPVVKYKYTADPAAMTYKGKVYLYTGHDVCPAPKERYEMNDWLVFSSSDMKTWTEHVGSLLIRENLLLVNFTHIMI